MTAQFTRKGPYATPGGAHHSPLTGGAWRVADDRARLQSVEFVSKVLDHDAALGDYGESLYGVNRREPFMCVERRAVG